jgi:tetratricopeptide (TPR) repeat protein
MALSFLGDDVTIDELNHEILSPERKGSLSIDLVTSVRRRGKIAYVIEPKIESLLSELAAGYPVIVFQNLGLEWSPLWHYAVAYGYDLEEMVIYLRSGKEEAQKIQISLFERTWRRSGKWALVVLPPGIIPLKAKENMYLKSALGLELVRKLDEAIVSYRAATIRWPESETAKLSLISALYRKGDKDEAEDVLRSAVEINPNSAPLLNNYAHFLYEKGLYNEALAYAAKAANIDGPYKKACTRTLRDIENRVNSP